MAGLSLLLLFFALFSFLGTLLWSTFFSRVLGLPARKSLFLFASLVILSAIIYTAAITYTSVAKPEILNIKLSPSTY